jgi:hypothetical protein
MLVTLIISIVVFIVGYLVGANNPLSSVKAKIIAKANAVIK